MGFAVSITVAIIFLSFIVIGSISYPVLSRSYKDIQESMDEKHKIQMDELNTAINISTSKCKKNDPITVNVNNLGSVVLNASRSNVLVNGVNSRYTVNPTGFWLPKKAAVFYTMNCADNGVYEIKIITENGNSDERIIIEG